MPSLQHAVVARFLGIRRSNYSPDDVPEMRRRLVRDNRRTVEGPPRDVRRTHEVEVTHERGFAVHTLQRSGTATPRRTVLYLHGGAFVKPSAPQHWRFATRLADALDARVVLPIYPLAPEFGVEDSFDDVLALYAELVAGSPDGVVLAGDSAGGGYALALALAIRDGGGPQPESMVLLAPWVDLTGTTPGTEEASRRDPWLSLPHLSIYAAFWAGSATVPADPALLAGPRLSPGLGDLTGLPPTLMFCGTRDLLQPGCDALFERAEEAGWSLEYVVGPGLLHVYPLLPVPEARAALAHAVDFCRRAPNASTAP